MPRMFPPISPSQASRLLVPLLFSACTAHQPAPAIPAPASEPELPVVRSDSAAIARARADSVRYPWTEADARFMTNMVAHHAQAITMSRLARPNGASPAVQRLADRIINAQVDEIVTMQQWLADRRQPVPEAHFDAAHVHHHLMPGMLTESQLRELAGARGAAFDRLFLTHMIRHHRGAVSMVKELFGTPGAGQDEIVFKFASDVNVDQTTEIARMEQMLSAVSSNSPAPQPRNHR